MDEVSVGQVAPAAGVDEERLRANVRLIVLELAPNQDRTLGDDARLLEDLGYHSVGLMELAFTLEDEYDLMPIDEATGRSIRTIRDVQDHVAAEVMARTEAAAEG